ncbi:hypothetical protein DSS3P8_163 [Roseobacter phage DSS3P8]|nr:hypothetical protein DSS3P8_163 [Roseobacter phage DSS3P8]
MSFLKTIKRLREAVEDRERRMRDPDLVAVRRRDLRDLIEDWESLDNKVRAQYYKDHPELLPTGYNNVDP